jgi:hypothetical protein
LDTPHARFIALSTNVKIHEEDQINTPAQERTTAAEGFVISSRFDLRNKCDPGNRSMISRMTVLWRFIHPRKASTNASMTRIAGNSATILKYEIAAASLGVSCFNIVRLAAANDLPICRK